MRSRIVFLQVGQGDCTLIQDAGVNILVDAAGADEYVDLGQRLAVPNLRKLGVQKIDMVLLTHPDRDHVGGLSAIAARFPVATVGIPQHFKNHPEVLRLRREMPHLDWVWLRSGQKLEFGKTKLLFDFQSGEAEDNAGSLACMILMGRSRAVLTGDAPKHVEQTLAARGDWHAEVIMAGHHGSATSTSSEWLNEVQPRFAVISCGRGNRYGHPNTFVERRLEAAGAKIFRTDRDGTTIFTPTDQGFQPANN